MRARDFLKEQQAQGIQQAITQKVNTIYDIDELNKIHAYVSRLDIGSGFDELFDRDVDLKQVQGYLSKAINEAPGTVEDKIGFARELVKKGVINVKTLFTPNASQNIMDNIDTLYPEIFEAVVPTLLNISGSFASGGVKTNKGKGEFFLALCSPLINLSKKSGDIEVSGKAVEVKANLSRIKGRKGYGTTDQALAQADNAVTDFLKNNIKSSAGPAPTHPTFSTYLGANATLWDQFGPYCMQNGVASGPVINFLQEQLKHIVRSLYLKLPNSLLQPMLDTIKQNGVMDKREFLHYTKITAFEYYKASDHFKGIFFVNGTTMDCVYIEDSASFADIINVAKWGYEPGQQNGLQIRV